MKACIFTLGCKVNEVESASVAAALESWGVEISDKLCPADVYILNTCAVTREAEKKSRQLVSRARKFNPKAEVYVIGCASEKDGAVFSEKGVTYVGGARNKNALIETLAEKLGLSYVCRCNEQGYDIMPAPKSSRTRTFIKIEDGCNNFCSYCIIPYLRGRIRSRAPSEIKAEILESKCPEAVLTGINISAYSYEGIDLARLISSLSGVKQRIRLGSLECGVIDVNLLNACRKLENFAPQFHLSLQSGSNDVLRKMNRRYTREKYLEKCELIYSAFPDAAITTDIIAGFPSETDLDFEKSLSIISEARLARVHAFCFSPREGTAAFKMKDLPASVKEMRLKKLLDASAEAEDAFIKRNEGSIQTVIFEDFDGEYTSGYTGNYIKVYLGENVEGKTIDVKIGKRFSGGAVCTRADADVASKMR